MAREQLYVTQPPRFLQVCYDINITAHKMPLDANARISGTPGFEQAPSIISDALPIFTASNSYRHDMARVLSFLLILVITMHNSYFCFCR